MRPPRGHPTHPADTPSSTRTWLVVGAPVLCLVITILLLVVASLTL